MIIYKAHVCNLEAEPSTVHKGYHPNLLDPAARALFNGIQSP